MSSRIAIAAALCLTAMSGCQTAEQKAEQRRLYMARVAEYVRNTPIEEIRLRARISAATLISANGPVRGAYGNEPPAPVVVIIRDR